MAQAIGAGLITKGVLKPENIWASARTEKTLESWKKLGTNTTLNSAECVNACDLIFLAVKPHMLDEALQFVRTDKVTAKRRVFVSVLVGVTLKALRSKLSRFGNYAVIRTMPNTPLLIGSGITVYCGDSHTLPDDYAVVHKMFSQLGTVEQVPEFQINAISALSGCGPAFGYQIIEALSDGGVMVGVPRAMATKFAAEVLIGSARMILETGRHPGQLKDEVCSPGGTTIAGVHEMEDGGVRASMMNAIKAAFERSQELAEESEDS